LHFGSGEAEPVWLRWNLETAAIPLDHIIVADQSFVEEAADTVEIFGRGTPSVLCLARGSSEAAIVIGEEAAQDLVGRGEVVGAGQTQLAGEAILEGFPEALDAPYRNAKLVRIVSTPGTRPQLQVRPATEEDAAQLCEIFNEAVHDLRETIEPDPRTVEDQRLRLAAAETDPKHPILVAELRNWVAGWGALAPYDPRIALDDIGEVIIYVRRSFRNYGVGRQLMRAMQEAARKLGYRKLVGRLLVENQDGLLLCRATGWREVGRHSAHARLHDGLHDVILVEYLIPPQLAAQPIAITGPDSL
jgi:putative acetyltransferase